MSKDEIIILSSDDESDSDSVNKIQNIKKIANNNLLIYGQSECFGQNNTSHFVKTSTVHEEDSKIFTKHQNSHGKTIYTPSCNKKIEPTQIITQSSILCKNLINKNKKPELVDLVEGVDMLPDYSLRNAESSLQDHGKQFSVATLYEIDENSENLNNQAEIKIIEKSEIVKFKTVSDKDKINVREKGIVSCNNFCNSESTNDKNLQVELEENNCYKKFVDLCSSLEKVPGDRARLIKKLYKRYYDADPNYINSEEFNILIEKFTAKLNNNNLYLIAKDVTDELCSRKRISVACKTSNLTSSDNKKSENILSEDKFCQKSKKKNRIIKKILKKLDLLGMRIRELEETEVDLSDEEDSSYIQLQRYRYRFCLVYKKLCEYTNEVSDANRVYCRRICFSGSKYPEINKCIENFLNKTKKFPDFNDIMKLLESQSSSLGLPSNREEIRSLAVEIFQKVGVMLQQRRKYDLWDSFCGYLNDSTDPANDDPQLEKVLKQNFDNRIKKEQEIISYYAERQDREKLKPIEVPEEEANLSPVESGNEEEKEIEEIENMLNNRLDEVIEEEHIRQCVKENDKNSLFVENDESDYNSENIDSDEVNKSSSDNKISEQFKESKNNFKNCKSLKWRGKKGGTLSEDVDDIAQEVTQMRQNGLNVETNDNSKIKLKEKKEETHKDDSDVECIYPEQKVKSSRPCQIKLSNIPSVQLNRIPKSITDTLSKSVQSETATTQNPLKRELNLECDSTTSKKIKILPDTSEQKVESEKYCQKNSSNFDDLQESKKLGASYEFRYVQIYQNFENVLYKLGFDDTISCNRKKDTHGKVFKDLTNIGRLLNITAKKKKSNFLTPTFYYCGIHDVEKPTWNNPFKVTYKFAVSKKQRCTTGQNDKIEKNIWSENKRSEDKIDSQSNSTTHDCNEYNLADGRGCESECNIENDNIKKMTEEEYSEEKNKNEKGEEQCTKGETENHSEKMKEENHLCYSAMKKNTKFSKETENAKKKMDDSYSREETTQECRSGRVTGSKMYKRN